MDKGWDWRLKEAVLNGCPACFRPKDPTRDFCPYCGEGYEEDPNRPL